MGGDATVGVNFVAQTQQALSSISSLESGLNRLAQAGKMLGMIGAGIYIGTRISNSLSAVISAGVNTETQMARLETAMGDVTKATRMYQKAVQAAASTPFEVDEAINAVVKLQAYSMNAFQEIGDTGVDTFSAVGNMAGAMGKSFDQATEAIAGAMTGQMERLRQFGITTSMLPPELARLERGSAKWREELLKYIATMPRFQGGMERLSRTMTGITSNIKDAFTQFVVSMANIQSTTSLYAKIKDFLMGIRDWLSKNMEAIVVVGRTISNILGHLWDILMIMAQPIFSLGRGIVAFFENIQKSVDAVKDRIGNTLSSMDKSLRAVEEVSQRIASFVALTFGWLKKYFKEFVDGFVEGLSLVWNTAKTVVGAILSLIASIVQRFMPEGETLRGWVVDMQGVGRALGFIVGVLLVKAFAAWIVQLIASIAWSRLLVSGALFAMVYLIYDLITNWNEMSTTMKVVKIIALALAAAIWIMNTPLTIQVLKWVLLGAAITAFIAIVAPLLVLYGLWTAAQWLLNVALTANPIGLVILAVAALIAIIIVVVKHWDKISAAILKFAKKARKWLLDLWKKVKDGFMSFIETIQSVASTVFDALTWPHRQAWEIIRGVWERISSSIGSVIDTIREYGARLVQLIVAPFKEAYKKIKEALGKVWDFLFGDDRDGRELRVSGTVSTTGRQPDGHRASGGPVNPGGAYLVGEQGPEMLVMGSVPGTVIPNTGTSKVANNNITLSLNIDASGTRDPNVVAQAVAERVRNTLSDITRDFGFV